MHSKGREREDVKVPMVEGEERPLLAVYAGSFMEDRPEWFLEGVIALRKAFEVRNALSLSLFPSLSECVTLSSLAEGVRLPPSAGFLPLPPLSSSSPTAQKRGLASCISSGGRDYSSA